MTSKIKLSAPDLTQAFPRSPRAKLGGYVLACRTLDKCRATVAGTAGEYHFDCPLDRIFFDFTGIDSEAFQTQVAEGASDKDMAGWIEANAKKRDRIEIIRWNNELLTKRIIDLPDELQLFLEDYIDECLPKDRPVYVWFDVYDLEEERL